MEKTQEYLLNLLKAAINEQAAAPPPSGLDWNILYKFAKFHSVANTAYYAILKLPVSQRPQEDIYQKFKMAAKKTEAAEAVQHFEGEAILSELETRGIACMPLKGWIIKHYYPHPAMRSMGDLDILFDPEYADLVPSIMKSLGYSVKILNTGCHDSYTKAPYMMLEMHRSLGCNPYFDHCWKRAVLKKEHVLQYEMTPEDTYLYLLSHMKKHYSDGGAGIRSVLDIWVYLRNFDTTLDWNYINTILIQLNLKSFADCVVQLAYAWFSDQPITKNLSPFQDAETYILSSGTYGTLKHLYARSIAEKKKDLKSNKRTLILQRAFPSLYKMKYRYPILRRFPFLLVFTWFLRIAVAPFRNLKRTKQELQTIRQIDDKLLKNVINADRKS